MQACGREQDCIQVYKTVEQTHPVTAIKKQAAELRFIMEAPKLQLRPEERISLPLLDNLDRYKYVSMPASDSFKCFRLLIAQYQHASYTTVKSCMSHAFQAVANRRLVILAPDDMSCVDTVCSCLLCINCHVGITTS